MNTEMSYHMYSHALTHTHTHRRRVRERKEGRETGRERCIQEVAFLPSVKQHVRSVSWQKVIRNQAMKNTRAAQRNTINFLVTVDNLYEMHQRAETHLSYL